MRDVGILLPGKIGDIIICLPIAKFYSDAGHRVRWFTWPHITRHFINGNIDYVEFIDVDFNNNCTKQAESICLDNNWELLDLSFTNVGSWGSELSTKYQHQDTMSFDEFRYNIADVDFNEKWNLDIRRIQSREEELYSKVVSEEKYFLSETNASDTRVNITLDMSQYSGDHIKVQPLTDCVFDWLTIIERADGLMLVESCFSNLVDQLSIHNRKQILLTKKGYYGDQLVDGRPKGLPVLRNEWEVR